MDKKIGRIEKISFPDLKIESIETKIDTGAYGIALHANGIKVIDDKLHFWINEKSNEFIFDKFRTVVVKNSFGRVQKRYAVYTKIVIGGSTYKFFISLTNRKKMKYPVLIGRRFLKKFNYIVDVRATNVNDRDKKM